MAFETAQCLSYLLINLSWMGPIVSSSGLLVLLVGVRLQGNQSRRFLRIRRGCGSPCGVTHRPSGAAEDIEIGPVTYTGLVPLGTLRGQLGYRPHIWSIPLWISQYWRTAFFVSTHLFVFLVSFTLERHLYLALLFIAHNNNREGWKTLFTLCGISWELSIVHTICQINVIYLN
jgi:hypothetical protein